VRKKWTKRFGFFDPQNPDKDFALGLRPDLTLGFPRALCPIHTTDTTVELSRVGTYEHNSQLAHDDCRRVRSHRSHDATRLAVGKFVQTRPNCRQLVANSVHTADVIQFDSCVASASAVCIGRCRIALSNACRRHWRRPRCPSVRRACVKRFQCFVFAAASETCPVVSAAFLPRTLHRLPASMKTGGRSEDRPAAGGRRRGPGGDPSPVRQPTERRTGSPGGRSGRG